MNYAFLGRLMPKSQQSEIQRYSKKNMQDAANALQWHLYNGLCENLDVDIKLINLIPIGSFPQYYKKLCVKKVKFDTSRSKENVSVGFCNLKFYKTFSIRRKIKKEIVNWCKIDKENRFLFIYTLSPEFLYVICKIKKRYPDLKVCAIVADLPDMISLSNKKSAILRKYETNRSKKTYSRIGEIDFFVLLTKQMADYMKIKKPFCVVEGVATIQDKIPNFYPSQTDKKIILYTGTLHQRFGVMNLVNAFGLINEKNYELVLCGIGDSENEIKQAALNDSRIKFLGQLSRDEVLELQKKASVLVNPRQNIEEFTKYSFPSKNLEYLSSGKPLIAYKLDGIPDEYDDLIFYVKDNSLESLASKVVEVCEMRDGEIFEHCKKAYEYVAKNKNEVVQTEKILHLLNKEQII